MRLFFEDQGVREILPLAYVLYCQDKFSCPTQRVGAKVSLCMFVMSFTINELK
jgi:hypothetical protein